MNPDRKVLDSHLQIALDNLFTQWHDPKVGLVAAALVDGDKVVYAVSINNTEGKRKHAERSAIELFKAKYGKPSPNAIMVVSLAPCYKDYPTREDCSCCALLKQEGVNKLYVGAMDKLQERNLKTYQKMGFETEVCKNPNTAKCCYLLAQMFSLYQFKDGERSWNRIKQEIEKTPQDPKQFFQTKCPSSQMRV